MSKRKRTQKNKKENKKIHQKIYREVSTPKKKSNYYIAISLIVIFCLVLTLNSYFNYTSGIAHNPDGQSLGTKFFLAGPDPYYNMRLCEETLETGQYPFVELSDGDPLLNYPVGVYAGARPPLFNMVAVGSAKLLGNFMPELDALGWSMLFLPAIYGALLIFPVYGIGKSLFNKKVGLIAALLIPIIPIHLGAGHGSAFTLFDHDSFLLLLFTLTFYFIIKALKQSDRKNLILYSIFAGITIGCIEMTWVASQAVYVMLIIYLMVQLAFDIFKPYNLKRITPAVIISIALFVGYLISFPYILAVSKLTTHLFFMGMISIGIIFIYLILYKLKLPWLISIPILATISSVGLGFLYMVANGTIVLGGMFGSIVDVADVVFGEGIYGYKVALTIAEAHTSSISNTVMSFGPALFWIGLTGFILYIYKTIKTDFDSTNLFFITIFTMQFWLTTTAGRFLNDFMPFLIIMAGYVIYRVLVYIDYKKVYRLIESKGIFSGLKMGMSMKHWIGVSAIVGLVLLPNSFLALDAAVPYEMKEEVFGEGYTGAFGLSLGQQYYWADACYWLSQQDTNFSTDAERPGILTWWDYGFYLSSMSKHPTVADNYQEGIECAGNFHTAQTEKEAVSVLIIRLVEGTKEPKRSIKGTIPQSVKTVFDSHLGNKSKDIINIIEDPKQFAPTYDTLFASEWGNTYLRKSEINAMYHDVTDILITLSDDELTNLYMSIKKTTGYDIKYYGVESRDMYSIFGVFPFLSDKSVHGYVTDEDDWYRTKWMDKNTNIEYTSSQLDNLTQTKIDEMELSPFTERKDAYFNSMAYKTFFGIREDRGTDTLPNNRVPTYFLKHWVPAYVSSQIIIARYYEGAKIKGTVETNDSINISLVYVFDEFEIPHDVCLVQNNLYNVIAPAGNVTLKLYKGTNYLDEIKIYVTEEEATRQIESNHIYHFKLEEQYEN